MLYKRSEAVIYLLYTRRVKLNRGIKVGLYFLRLIVIYNTGLEVYIGLYIVGESVKNRTPIG